MSGFTPIDQQNEICVCKKGSGLDRTGKLNPTLLNHINWLKWILWNLDYVSLLGQTCIKCKNGYFSDKEDSTCQKLRV